MEEIWKDILGYEGRYQISNLGNVYSLLSRKLMKPWKNNAGYLLVHLRAANGRYQHCLVHRLVASTFLKNSNNFPIVNHIDGNPLNNRADNLEWCTYKYNNTYGGDNSPMKHLKDFSIACKITNLSTGECSSHDSFRAAAKYAGVCGKNLKKDKMKNGQIVKGWLFALQTNDSVQQPPFFRSKGGI